MSKRPWYVQCLRGCSDLPHVGSHPGTMWIIFMITAGAAAGAERGGVNGAIGGALFMAIGLVPFYLAGAYYRAKDSDRRTATEGSKNGGNGNAD